MDINRIDNADLNTIKMKLETLLQSHAQAQGRSTFKTVVSFGFEMMHDDQVVGAILCKQTDEVVHIELLGVEDAYQHQHIGTHLIHQVEVYALEHGCTRLTLTTLDYQAKEFYERVGFEVFGVLDDTPSVGTTKYYMTKKCG